MRFPALILFSTSVRYRTLEEGTRRIGFVAGTVFGDVRRNVWIQSK
jgi:hypothetical protein